MRLPSLREVARQIAYVPQAPVIPTGTTVREYVLLGRNPHIGYWRSEGRRDVLIAGEEIERLREELVRQRKQRFWLTLAAGIGIATAITLALLALQ